MITRRFALKFLAYLLVVIAIHAALFTVLGGIGMANDTSTEERESMSAPLLFIVNKVFGFPLSLFLPYDPINDTNLSLSLILLFLCNCLIQFSILSFLWRKLRERRQP